MNWGEGKETQFSPEQPVSGDSISPETILDMFSLRHSSGAVLFTVGSGPVVLRAACVEIQI